MNDPRRRDGRASRRLGYGLIPILMLGGLAVARPARPAVPVLVGARSPASPSGPVVVEVAARAAVEPGGIDPGIVIYRSAEIDPRFVVERSAEIDPRFVINPPTPGAYVFVPEGPPRRSEELARSRHRPARR